MFDKMNRLQITYNPPRAPIVGGAGPRVTVPATRWRHVFESLGECKLGARLGVVPRLPAIFSFTRGIGGPQGQVVS